MSWFTELAGKAENLLNNLDEQTGAVLRNHGNVKQNNGMFFQPNSTLGQRKRQPPKVPPKMPPRRGFETRSNCSPTRKISPSSDQRSPVKGHYVNENSIKTYQDNRNKSPTRKPTKYNLNHSPKTLVDDFKHDCDQLGLRKRRLSLPTDLEIVNQESLTYNMQNLEVENAMLKNELNVMNREVSELLDSLRTTKDELTKTQNKLDISEKINNKINLEKDGLILQLNEVRSNIEDVSMIEISKQKEERRRLDNEIKKINDNNNDLEDRIKNLSEELIEKSSKQTKLEKDFKQSQFRIVELESELEKSNLECNRLEKEWESYKLRVKNMLNAKDCEIKALREGANLSEDTRELVEQIDQVKEERDHLSEVITSVRNECNNLNQQMRHLEARHSAAERVAIALRDALKDERNLRNRAELQANTLGRELKAMQMEMGQTITGLRTILQRKEQEILDMKEASVPTSDSSALNVADYDVMHNMDNDKINYLTQTLVQKQGKIDMLLADNNILKIQLEKLESKFKTELASARAQYTHSVIHLQDESRRARFNASPLSKLSLRIGFIMKRFPLLRIFIIFYMIGLHFWVMTVLFTSSPENYVVLKS